MLLTTARSEFGGGGYINVYTGDEDGESPVSAGSFAITLDPIDEGSLTSGRYKRPYLFLPDPRLLRLLRGLA